MSCLFNSQHLHQYPVQYSGQLKRAAHVLCILDLMNQHIHFTTNNHSAVCVLIQTCLHDIANDLLLIVKPLLFYVGIPNNMVVLRATGKKKSRLHGSLVSLAEYGTFGVEFLTLSDRTGNATYANSAEAVYRSVSAILPPTHPPHPHLTSWGCMMYQSCCWRLLQYCLQSVWLVTRKALVNLCLSAMCYSLAAPLVWFGWRSDCQEK